VVVAAAGILVTTGLSDVAGSSGRHSSDQVEKEVSALLSRVPQSGETLGQASAPITLEIVGDLESKDVRTFAVWLLPDIIRQWVLTNIVKIQYRSFMTASLPYPNVFVRQQTAALAAGVQDKLWNFIEIFYHEQGEEDTRYVTEAYLDGIARQVPGLNLSEWESDRENSQLTKRVTKESRVSQAIGFRDTPAFLIGRTGGKLTPWLVYRLYEEPGPGPGYVHRALHPLSFITSKTLKNVVEHLP
jgi:thioredoxin family protein